MEQNFIMPTITDEIREINRKANLERIKKKQLSEQQSDECIDCNNENNGQ